MPNQTRTPSRTELVDANVRSAANLRQAATAARTAARSFNDHADALQRSITASAIDDEVVEHLTKYARAQADALTARAIINDRQADDLEKGL